MTFEHLLTLPPTDNHLKTRSNRGGMIASDAYRTWLYLEAPRLRDALRFQGYDEPDRAHWWMLSGNLYLPRNAGTDPSNYIKATQDLLGGAQVVDTGHRGGRIEHLGGLVAVDRQFRGVSRWLWVELAADGRGCVSLTARTTSPPIGWIGPPPGQHAGRSRSRAPRPMSEETAKRRARAMGIRVP